MLRILVLCAAVALHPLVSAQNVESVLDANFDDKTLGQPIGTGGAINGEPISITPTRLDTEIVSYDGGRALRVTRVDTGSSNTGAGAVRFEFVEGREISRGPLRISARLQPEDLGGFAVRTREAGGTSARAWVDIELTLTGAIRRVVGGNSVVIGSYTAGQPLDLVLIGDFNARSYRVLVNDVELDTGSFDFEPGTRGVGAVLFSVLSGSQNFDKSFVFDEVLVESAATRIFSDRFQSN